MLTPAESLIEIVLEFFLKQIARQGLPQVQKAWRRVKLFRPFVPRTRLINREPELRTLRTALTETSHLRILYLSGPGGVGKTRLLEESGLLCRKLRAELPLRWSGILDLYHTDLHSVAALTATVIRGLDPDEQHFRRYLAARRRFEQRRAEGLSGTSLDKERQKLNELFLEDYRDFAQQYRPVLAFDTLESLRHESDLIQALCQIEAVFIETHYWLLQWIEHLHNSVLLLAGRPQPALQRSWQQAHRADPGRLEILEINGLSREDSRRLLELFLKSAPAAAQVLRQQSDQLWQLTGGRPVQLALIVELVSQSTFDDSVLAQSSGDKAAWGKRLVGALFNYSEPDSRIFFLLALARKGLTADLLHYLEPDWPKDECQQRLGDITNLTVVKTRPGSEEIFLHDALYELFDAYAPPLAQLQPWYERLADYYRMKQAQAGGNGHRTTRRQTTINLLYYELHCNPREAFEAGYTRWNELAIKGYEVGLDMQLRDELLRFFQLPANEQRAAAQGLTTATIERDSAVRWVKRFVAQTQYEKARSVAETILALGPAPYFSLVPESTTPETRLPTTQEAEAKVLFAQAEPFFWGHLLTYYGEALTYTGTPEAYSRQILNQAVNLLDDAIEQAEPLNWLRERVLGRVHNTTGYLLRTYGHYAGALMAYHRALKHFDAAGVKDEQADTLNNLAFLLALLGDVERAKEYADQALALRQQLGQRYPLALSYNTRGRISAWRGQFEWGLSDCRLALSIFEELDAPRGVGLACNALGFILRLRGEGWKQSQCSSDDAAYFFEEAATFLEQAATVFSEEVQEPLRLWEAHNEQGSLYCDWAYLLKQQKDEATAQAYYAKAVDHHLSALNVAQRYGLHFQEADTCDDLAQVWADQGKLAVAQQWLQQCLRLVPDEYQLAIKQGFSSGPEVGEAFWFVLGKIHLQRGIWTFRAIAQVENPELETVQEGIEHFFLAAVYFQRYWPNTRMLNARLQTMAYHIDKASILGDNARDILEQLSSQHGVDITAFLDLLGSNTADEPGEL